MDERTPTQPSLRRRPRVRHPPQPRPRAELPHRLEPARGHRAPGRAGSPDDVVLEIGGGLGVLSEYLAARVEHVHVVELDRRLEPALRDATDAHDNVSLHGGDATAHRPDRPHARARQGGRQPPVRHRRRCAPAHGRGTLPSVARWVTMVQREVGERLAAAPGSAAYGPRACWPSWPARSRSPGRYHAPSSNRCPTSTRCSSSCNGARPGAAARPARARARRLRSPAQGAARSHPWPRAAARSTSAWRRRRATRCARCSQALGKPADAPGGDALAAGLP